MKKLIVVIALAASAQAHASKWVELDPGWSVDAESLVVQGDLRRIWISSINPSSGAGAERALIEIDCQARIDRTLHKTIYDKQGVVMQYYDGKPSPWQYIVPDSLMDLARKFACAGVLQRPPTFKPTGRKQS